MIKLKKKKCNEKEKIPYFIIYNFLANNLYSFIDDKNFRSLRRCVTKERIILDFSHLLFITTNRRRISAS